MVNKRHDYEATTVDNRRYVMDIVIGTVSHLIDLNLINIFDNTPMIQYNVPCNFDVSKQSNFIIKLNFVNSYEILISGTK